MGHLFSKNVLEKSAFKQKVDKVFYELADTDRDDPNTTSTINSTELYVGVLLTYHEVNKALVKSGMNLEPPSRTDVYKLFEEFDKDNSGAIDRTEFEDFLLKFIGNTSYRVTRNLVVMFVAVPLLVMGTRKLALKIPKAAPIVEKIPQPLLAIVFMASLNATGLGVV